MAESVVTATNREQIKTEMRETAEAPASSARR